MGFHSRVLLRCVVTIGVLASLGCATAGSGGSPERVGLGAGIYRFSGTGSGGDGLERSYAFVRDEYVLESRNRKSGSHEIMHGRWELRDGRLHLLQTYRVFWVDGLALERKPDLAPVEITSRKITLSASGDALTIEREDGNCPGSSCTRTYKLE